MFVSSTRVFIVLLLTVLAACKPVNDRKEIKVVRKMGKLAPEVELGLSLMERVTGKSEEELNSAASDVPFAWDVPDGWQVVPGSAMRMANFTFGDSAEGQCYFTMLRGGGGLLLNLNRWREQMGLDPVDDAAIAQLPERRFLFGNGRFIELDGDFKSMGAAEALPNYKMLGLIMPEMDMGGTKVAFFVKMTGPKALVEAQLNNFNTFCASIRIKRVRQ